MNEALDERSKIQLDIKAELKRNFFKSFPWINPHIQRFAYSATVLHTVYWALPHQALLGLMLDSAPTSTFYIFYVRALFSNSASASSSRLFLLHPNQPASEAASAVMASTSRLYRLGTPKKERKETVETQQKTVGRSFMPAGKIKKL